MVEKVRHLTEQHGARLLLVSLCGSRAFGYAAPDSDYDVRFIYVFPLPRYFSLTPVPDEIRLKDDDIVGYELGKFLSMGVNNGWTAAEMLVSPILYEAAEPAGMLDGLRELLADTFRPAAAMHSLISCAVTYRKRLAHLSNQEEDKRHKFILGCIRVLLAALHISEHRCFYPIPLQELAAVVRPQLLPDISLLTSARANPSAVSVAETATAAQRLSQAMETLHEQVAAMELPPDAPSSATVAAAFYLRTVQGM